MSDAVSTTPAPSKTSEWSDPLVIDFGKSRRKDVKALREGRGPLVAEIASCLDELQASGQLPKGAQPVVIVVRERRKKSALFPLT